MLRPDLARLLILGKSFAAPFLLRTSNAKNRRRTGNGTYRGWPRREQQARRPAQPLSRKRRVAGRAAIHALGKYRRRHPAANRIRLQGPKSTSRRPRFPRRDSRRHDRGFSQSSASEGFKLASGFIAARRFAPG